MGLEQPLQKKTFDEFSLTPDQRAKLNKLARTKHPAWIEFYQAFLHCQEYTVYGMQNRFYEGAIELLRKLEEQDSRNRSVYDQRFAERIAEWMNDAGRG